MVERKGAGTTDAGGAAATKVVVAWAVEKNTGKGGGGGRAASPVRRYRWFATWLPGFTRILVKIYRK